MAYPSSATQGMALHYLFTGYTWETFVNDEATEENLGSEENVEICAPNIMMWAGEDRTVNGNNLSYGSPGLNHFTDSSHPDFTSHRWVRVVRRPQNADEMTAWDGPIRQRGDGTDDQDSAWFEVSSWVETLSEGGWGGVEVNLTVYDPTGIYDGHFTEGRAIGIYVEEFEGSGNSLISASELFSGFVIVAENQDTNGVRVYQLQCGTIERLYMRRGNDGGAALFVSEPYINLLQQAPYQPGQGVVAPSQGLVAGVFTHTFSPYLTPGRVIAHIILWHMWVRVNGSTHRLAEVCNLRRDYWNDIPAGDADVPGMALQPGNVMGQLSGMFPQGVYLGYSARTSDFTVTVDHEYKATADATLDTIDMNYCYSAKELPGKNDTVGQVIMVQALTVTLTRIEGIQEFKYPTSAIPNRSIHRSPLPIIIRTTAGGNRVCKGTFDKLNSRDMAEVVVRGAKWSLHNKLSVFGKTYSAIRVVHAFDADTLGSHEITILARRIVIS